MPVTEITFDPRIDLPAGTLGVFNVTVKATPTRIRDDGTATVYPQTVQFQNVTAETPFHLQSTDGTWAWLIGVYNRQKILDIRTVFVTGNTAAYTDLVDVDPNTFIPVAPATTVASTLAAFSTRIGTVEALPRFTDAGIAAFVGDGSSTTNNAIEALIATGLAAGVTAVDTGATIQFYTGTVTTPPVTTPTTFLTTETGDSLTTESGDILAA